VYEKVKKHLLGSGYRKFNTSSSVFVRDDMLFTIAPQGKKNDINVWFAIYPLVLPSIWINQGWLPAAGSYPKVDGVETNIPFDSDDIELSMIEEIENNIFPFFNSCTSLNILEALYSQGNFRSRFPQAFTLLGMQEYKKGQQMLREITQSFDTEPWGTRDRETISKYTAMKDFTEIESSLELERIANIKKHKLVRFMNSAGTKE